MKFLLLYVKCLHRDQPNLVNPNLGGLFRGSFCGVGAGGGGGVKYTPLSQICYNYARNFKFGT